MAVLEKKLEVLSAALGHNDTISESPANTPYVIPTDQSPSPIPSSREVFDTHSNAQKPDNGSQLPPNLLGPNSSFYSETLQGMPTKYLDPSLQPPKSNSGTPDTECSRDVDTSLKGNMMIQDIVEVREKMVGLWNMMTENANHKLSNLEDAPRMRTPTYETDAVASGLITIEDAQTRFNIYRDDLYAKYTLVDIPPNITADDLRRESPILFLTIMAITSVAIRDFDQRETCITLHNQATDAIIYETMILGNKTLELLKCLILLILWYNTPEMYHHQKSHLITHLCTTLAIDLGIGGATFESTPQTSGIKYDRILRPFQLVNPRTAECRKLWLCVYISTIHVSVVIKRPVYLMWSQYTEECCQILEQKDRSQVERRVAALARLNHLHEEMTTSLQGCDSLNPPDVNDPRTRCLIKHFEHKLQKLSGIANLGSSLYASVLYIMQICLHESVMYTPVSPELGRAPYCEYSLAMGSMTVSVHSAQAIGWCYSGAMKTLEVMAALTSEELAVMPLFCYIRMAFGASTLLKLRTLYLTTPDFHQICTVKASSLKPISILMAKLDKVISEHPFANSAANFCFVLHVLICHFDRQLHYFFHPEENPNRQQPKRPQQPSQPQQTRGYQDTMSPRTSGMRSTSDGILMPKRTLWYDREVPAEGGIAEGGGGYTTTTPGNLGTPTVRLNEPKFQMNNNMSNTTPMTNMNNNDGGGSGMSMGSKNSNGLMMNSSTTPTSAKGGNTPTHSATSTNSYSGNVYLRPPTPSVLDRRYSELQPDSPLDILSSVAIDGTLQKRLDSQEVPDGYIDADPVDGGVGSGSESLRPLMMRQMSSGGGMAKSRSPSSHVQVDNMGCSGNSGQQGSNSTSSAEYPSWLVTDDFWKELVPGAEALSGFDLY